MGRLISICLLIITLSLLQGCPAKDWMKRDDAYLSVEQYRTMTEVIRINDILYRVKKGEEINQNKITQLFVNLQNYINMSQKQRQRQLGIVEIGYKSGQTMFNTMSFVLLLLETKGKENEAHKILSQLDHSNMSLDDKNLFNLAQILQGVLTGNRKLRENNLALQNNNTQLEKNIDSINTNYELVQEEMIYLKKQVNALKSIEESIHAREVGLEVEGR